MPYYFFDAFSGVGGFRLGFERAGFKCVGYSETDKFATKLYSEYFNDKRNYGDITKINPEQLPDFHVITGGLPCQPFSLSGRKKGLEDDRGMPIWRAFFRIIEYKKPDYIVIENVKGLLTSNKGRDFAWVLYQMAKLGYSIEWMVLNSKDFGVPQNRERVFIIAYTGGEYRPKIFPIRDSEKTYYTPVKGKETFQTIPNISNTIRAEYYKLGTAGPYIIHGDRDPIHKPILIMLSNTKANIKQRIQARNITWTLDTSGTKFGIIDPKTMEMRKITPLEAFRLQGFPDDIVKMARKIGISDTQLYRMAGNAVTVQIIQSIANKILRIYREKKKSR